MRPKCGRCDAVSARIEELKSDYDSQVARVKELEVQLAASKTSYIHSDDNYYWTKEGYARLLSAEADHKHWYEEFCKLETERAMCCVTNENKLNLAISALEFYANWKSWHLGNQKAFDNTPRDCIRNDSGLLEYTETDGDKFTDSFGGKRAREALAKLKGEM